MLDVVHHKGTARKFRLCAVAFCRSVIPLLEEHRSEVEQIVAVAEQFADGGNLGLDEKKEELEATYLRSISCDYWNVAAIMAAMMACRDDAFRAARGVVRHTTAFTIDVWARTHHQRRRRGKEHRPAKVAHSTRLCALIRDIFGPVLFRSIPLDAYWLTWNGGTIMQLAEDAYERRIMPVGALDPDRLAVLADALEEAGCDNADLLTHLRGPGPHCRGCWVLDRLTGRE
jgi:hypothetical protein